MRSLIAYCIAFFIGSTTLNAQTYQDLLYQAQLLYKKEQFKKAAKKYSEAFDMRSPRTQELEMAAKAWALSGEKEEALNTIALGIHSGWLTIDFLVNEEHLSSLHAHPRWEELLQQLLLYTQGSKQDLRKELIALAERDQFYRIQIAELAQKEGWNSPLIPELMDLQKALDQSNLAKVDSLITIHGYPGRSLVGPQGNIAFLIIQRGDLETQLKYLPLLTQAADDGELYWADLATMVDKVRIAQGLEQVYGTQVKRTATGEMDFYPIEHAADINHRRKAVHLMPIEEYAQRLGMRY